MARKPIWQDKIKANQRYGKWVICEPCVIFREGSGVAKVWARCDCGNKRQVNCAHLSRGNSKSCGCIVKSKGKEHPAFKGSGDISKTKYNDLTRGLIASAPSVYLTTANLGTATSITNATDTFPISVSNGSTNTFDLSPELLNNQLRVQNYSCSISGQPINSDTGAISCLSANSGWVSGNITWVRKDYKAMQGNMDFETFVEMCRQVVNAVDDAREHIKPLTEKKSTNPVVNAAQQVAEKYNGKKPR